MGGFLTIDYPLPQSPEITWMAVSAPLRRKGIGQALIAHAVRELAAPFQHPVTNVCGQYI